MTKDTTPCHKGRTRVEARVRSTSGTLPSHFKPVVRHPFISVVHVCGTALTAAQNVEIFIANSRLNVFSQAFT